MRKSCLFLALLIALATSAFSQTPSKAGEQSANVEQSILQLTRDWLAAERAMTEQLSSELLPTIFRALGRAEIQFLRST